MKLVFDIDGVLIDTQKSYRHAIKQTAQHVLRHAVPMKLIDEIKSLEGMNNDWVATHALINRLLPPTMKPIAFAVIKDYFQSIYLGPKGLWKKETLIFSREQLQRLFDSTGPLSIITGRTFDEADFALHHFGIRELFDSITSVESQPEPMDKSDIRLLAQVPNIQTFEKILYFGDNVSDLQLVQNARRHYPIESVWFTKTLGSMSGRYVKQIKQTYAPDYIVKTSQEALSLVINY